MQTQKKMGADPWRPEAKRAEGPNLSPEPDELMAAYQQLGKAYYEGGFEDPLPELLPLFDRITRLRWKRKQKAGIYCPNCGREVTSDSQFCSWCGTKLHG